MNDIIICIGCGAEIISSELYYETEYGTFHIECWDNDEDEDEDEDEDSE